MLKKTQKTKKLFLPILLLTVLAGFFVAPAALAIDTGLEYGTYTGLGAQDLRVSVMRIVQYALGFLGVLAVVIILYGGFLWLTSAGNEEKITTAKKVLINAVIGLAIIFLSFAIASFIINQLIAATGAGPGASACTPNVCVACYRRCDDTGTITAYDTTCDDECSLPPDPPANCPKPATPAPKICAVKTPQPPDFGGLAQGKVGDYVTIEGWYFGDYLAGTSKVNLDTAEMALLACDGAPLWHERESDNYGLVRVKVPVMATVPETYDLILTNKDNVASAASLFKVIDGIAGPQLACLAPPAAGNEDILDKAEGENFGTAAGQLIFNNNQPAVFESWAETLIDNPAVPTWAVSGDVKVTDTADVDSNGVYFTVICEANADCGSQCCQNFSCQPAAACLPGPGESCDPNEATADICEAGGVCQPGLICDDVSCQCRLPGPGESCDLTEDPVCVSGVCADDLVCGQTGCVCEAAPYISLISPNDGAAGNFITISGKQFGETAGKVHFLGDINVNADDQEARLASAVNAACADVWTSNQIIVAVPEGVISGPIIVVDAEGKFDLTNDGRGPLIPDFVANETVRPGLCDIEPKSGKPNDAISSLQGVNFINSSKVYFAQAQAGGAPLFSPDFKTITNITVPALDPATIGVRVLNGAEYSNPLNFEILASTLPPNACSSNPNICQPDSSQCEAGQYCSAACECVALSPCGGDDPATSVCEGAACSTGFFCNDNCLCQPALPCDENPNTPQCEAGTAICPANYTCDSNKNCTCQPQTGRADESAYTWSFITGRQPGVCSKDEGICDPDPTACEIGFTCNTETCNCDEVTTYPCSLDPKHLSCDPDQTQCPPKEYCDSSCECAPRIACSSDPNQCSPQQDLCPLGWYCYDETIHAADSNKLSCYCYQGILCDNPVKDASPANLACHPDDSYCPTNYICDANSNCTCQKSLGALTDSTYTWTFNTFSPRPKIVELCNRTGECRREAISSPAPYTLEAYDNLTGAHQKLSSLRPDDGEVPIDAVIAWQFDQRMNPATLVADNFLIAECQLSGNTLDCGDTNETPHATDVLDCNYKNQKAADSHCVKLWPTAFLKTNTYYRVLLKSDSILGENGLNLLGNYNSGNTNYFEWYFKTRNSDELSQVACLYLNPAASTLYSYDQRQKYQAWPAAEDFVCVDIRPESCNLGYGWLTADPNSSPAHQPDDTRAQIVPTTNHPKTNPEYDDIATDYKAAAAAHNDTILDLPNPYTEVQAICRFSDQTGLQASVDGWSNLTVDFSSPRVIDRFPDCGAACLNARIGATFNVAMDLFALQSATKLYNCYDDPTAPLSACALVSTFHAPEFQPPPEAPNTYIGDVDCFDYNGDGKNDYCLLPDNYYRVVIADTAISDDDINPRYLVGLNYDADDDKIIDSYAWIFKTQKNYGLCLPGQIDVAPAEKWAPKNIEIFYAARPKTKPDACDPVNGQRLNPYAWDWDWVSTFPDVADLVKPLRDACGNYVKEAGEDCDDGNLIAGDGCSEICLNEGFSARIPGNVLLLHLDEPSATDRTPIADASGQGNNCVLYTGNGDSDNKSLPGKLNTAISFDGVDDYINCGKKSDFNIADEITIEAWVYLNYSANPSPFPAIVAKYWDYSLQFRGADRKINLRLINENDGEIVGGLRGANPGWGSTGRTEVPFNKWTHLIATYDSNSNENNLRYYVDGQPDGAYSKSGKIRAASYDLTIGRQGSSYHLDGAIDEVAIYNRALSAEEIANRYLSCGNNKIDSGEECDPPGENYCGGNCLWLGNSNTEDVCGNGLVETSEECDPPKAGCGASCLLSGSVKDQSLCGDGKIGLGEECDTNELSSGNLPADGDAGDCSAKCLIENRAGKGYCRSKANNIFDFSKPCAGVCGEGYNCTALNTITGNTNNFSTCANGLIEKGEECDSGGYCAVDSVVGSWKAVLTNGYPTNCNTYGSFCGFGETCRAFEGYCNTDKNTLTQKPCNTDAQCVGAGLGGACWRDGCGQECINNGSVYEAMDPPNVGPYQIVETLADGETDIKANIDYVPLEGRGHLTVGAPPGKFGVIDYWPDCAWACLNAAVGGQFNQSAKVSTAKSNIFLYECGADGACDISGRNSIPGVSVIISKTALNNDTFQINLPADYNQIDNDNNPLTPLIPVLIPNTFYRVVVNNLVLTADGSQNLDANLNYNDPKITPAGGDKSTIDSFSWVFKTQPQDDLCSLDKVEIIPTPLTLSEGNIRYVYFSQPWALLNPYCISNRGQKLNAYHYDWRWDDWEVRFPQADNNGASFLLNTAGLPPTAQADLLPTNPTEADELKLKDGCGNGVLEGGEDCDPGFQSIPGCGSNCFWQGTAAPTCGNGQIDPGEECDPPGLAGYCGASCLWAGNTNYGISVCGNGIVEAGEACDTGDEPDNDESDGCTNICAKSGAVPAADSICGDGQITNGEECDQGELARGLKPVSADGCSGEYLNATNPNNPPGHVCSTYSTKALCEKVDFENHVRACYWTGRDCQVRPCLLEASSLRGNNNYNLPVCGNGQIEIGEECDDGNKDNGYCSADGVACASVGSACEAQGTCVFAGHCQLPDDGPTYINSCTIVNGPCTVVGECLADGCGPTCLNNGSVANDNRIDPFQIIETVTVLPSALSSVKEEIRAWYGNRVGVGELTVVSGAKIPFAVIGHQPEPNSTNQCPNAALWAVFSRPLDLTTVLSGYTCADAVTPCDPTQATACDNNQAECANKDSFLLCPGTGGCTPQNNLIEQYRYRPVQGVCVTETQKCDFGDLGEAVNFGEFCQNDSDCLASQLLVMKLKTATGFLNKETDYYFDVSNIKSSRGYCSGGRQVCQKDADCGGVSCDKGLETDNVTGREKEWTFKTGSIMCECNYVGVTIANTSGGAETVNDLFTCAGDNCGANTPDIRDDDVSLSVKLCHGGANDGSACASNADCPAGGQCVLGQPGNQHEYTAICWDVSHFTERQPVSPAGIDFGWLDFDPDKLIFITNLCSETTNEGLVCRADGDCPGSRCANNNYNDRSYITPGDDNKPAGKNGRSQVRARAEQYRLSATGEFCARGIAGCEEARAASQYVSVLNFICENPWPPFAAFPYRDNESNLKAPDTNFEMYYCRDFGQATTTDDLPALFNGPVLAPAGPVLKEFIFPVGALLTAAEGSEVSVLGKDLSGDGIITGEAKFKYGPGDGWQYTFTGLPAGNYAVAITSFNQTQDLTSGSFCDGNANSYLEDGENLACDPTSDTACASRPDQCLTGITHIIEVWVDAESQPRGRIVNFAAGATTPQTGQIGRLVVGNLSAGNHLIKLKWLNDYYNDQVNPALDSNLAILELSLEREAAGTGISSDALGIRVLPNPLHLSPKTWYGSGLCGGLESIDYLCYSDADCASRNLFVNGDFEAGLSRWEFQADTDNGASGNLVEINSGQNGRGAKLTLASLGGWGAELKNTDDSNATDIVLPAGRYVFSASVKSGQKAMIGVEDKGRGYAPVSCQNANCDNGTKVCNRQSGSWERLTCNFSLTQKTNTQFIVRLKDEAGEADIDNLLLAGACQKNAPDAGSGQVINIDGYQAVADGRSVYVGAANRVLGTPAALYSNIYLISYNQDAASQTKEIFNRILDQSGQKGDWYFNSDLTNNRICQGDIGYYEETDIICSGIGSINDDCGIKDRNNCENAAGAAAGCYWSVEVNGCLAHPCLPIYCWNNFDCPNLACDAQKEKVVRDAERFGDLRDLQLLLKKSSAKNRGLFPALAGGTYIAGTTFSVWPSWQETLGKDLGGNLYLDPLNRFKGCVDYGCDENKNGKIDGGETASCTFGDIAGCGNQPKLCVAKDLDQEKTCWQEIQKQFVCPVEMAVYAYRSANNANDYELYANFEYAGPGHWGLATNFYALPLSGLAGGGTCQRLNFKADKNAITVPGVTIDCSLEGGDGDFDGICDDVDNCEPNQCANARDCYNPDQRNSNYPADNIGDVCDFGCTGDKDGDRVCDDFDNCPTVSNAGQRDRDGDNYGDACDPCTDLDNDGRWDIKTSGTDESVCKKDNCPAGWCASGSTPAGGCYLNSDCPGSVCQFDDASFTGHPLKERRFLASDRRKYCSNNPLKTCADSGECNGGSCNDRKTYNPLQEDYDNDQVGYICDDCLDFDKDNKGDYSFYTHDKNFASTYEGSTALTPGQQEHFQGCQSADGFGAYFGFVLSTPDPNNFDFGSTGGPDDQDVDFGDVSDFASWMKSKTTDMPGLVCPIPALISVNCDANGDGDVNLEDVSFYADKIIKTNKLDNCTGGSFGFDCRDQFGIKVSCANAATAGNWSDIFGNPHLNSQRDTNLNGLGDLCDPWGNGKLDPGEACDCGDNPDGSEAAPNNPFTCTSGNGYPCELDSFMCASFCPYCANGGAEIKKQSSATYGNGQIDRICGAEQCDCGGGVNFTWTGQFQSNIYSIEGNLLGPYGQTCTTMNDTVCGGPDYSLACCFYCSDSSQPALGPAGGCCGDGAVQTAAGEECDFGFSFDENGNIDYKNGKIGPDGKIIGGCTAECKAAPGWVCEDEEGNPLNPCVACDCRAGAAWLEGWSCPTIECDGLLAADVSCNSQESCVTVPAPSNCNEGNGCGLINDPTKPCFKDYCTNGPGTPYPGGLAVPRQCVDTSNNGCCNIPPQDGETCVNNPADPANKYDWGCPLAAACSIELRTVPNGVWPALFLSMKSVRGLSPEVIADFDNPSNPATKFYLTSKPQHSWECVDSAKVNLKINDDAGSEIARGKFNDMDTPLRGGWVGEFDSGSLIYKRENIDFCFIHTDNVAGDFFVGDEIFIRSLDQNDSKGNWSARWGNPDPDQGSIGSSANYDAWEKFKLCDPSGWCGPCKTDNDCDVAAREICCGGVCKKPECTAATQDVDCNDNIDCSVDTCEVKANTCDNACKNPRDVINTCSATGDKCCPLDGAGQPLCSAAEDPDCDCGICNGACPAICNGSDPDCGPPDGVSCQANSCCQKGCDFSADLDCPIRVGDTVTIKTAGTYTEGCSVFDRAAIPSFLIADSGLIQADKLGTLGFRQFKFIPALESTNCNGVSQPRTGDNLGDNVCISFENIRNDGNYVKEGVNDTVLNYKLNKTDLLKPNELYINDIITLSLMSEHSSAGGYGGKSWSTNWCQIVSPNYPKIGEADSSGSSDPQKFKVCSAGGTCESTPGCSPDGGNNICPEYCDVYMDPDCGCLDGDGWCATGCTHADEPNDCPDIPCVPNGCGGGCPLNCTVAEDPDCGCADGNGCCGATSCGISNDTDCPLRMGDQVYLVTANHRGWSSEVQSSVNKYIGIDGASKLTTNASAQLFTITQADRAQTTCDGSCDRRPAGTDILQNGDCIALSPDGTQEEGRICLGVEFRDSDFGIGSVDGIQPGSIGFFHKRSSRADDLLSADWATGWYGDHTNADMIWSNPAEVDYNENGSITLYDWVYHGNWEGFYVINDSRKGSAGGAVKDAGFYETRSCVAGPDYDDGCGFLCTGDCSVMWCEGLWGILYPCGCVDNQQCDKNDWEQCDTDCASCNFDRISCNPF